MKNKHSRIIIISLSIAIIVMGLVGALYFKYCHKLPIKDSVRVFIPSGSTYDAVLDTLSKHGCLEHKALFLTLSKLRGYPDHICGGSYLFTPETSVFAMLNRLYRGYQDPVRLTIGRHRTKESLCRFLAAHLELDSADMMRHLNSDSVCQSYGLTPATIISMFIQNTYEFYWTTNCESLMNRMHKESDIFWNEKRTKQAESLGLSAAEVITLAAIVDEETNADSEKPLIASVYLNRLRKNIPLQADPTVRFAVGDFTLRRITGQQLSVVSPYNTYTNLGLPPGPIVNPSIASIDAVLANKQTDYLFFCAKNDFSGTHTFACDFKTHQRNARNFHKALNKRNIYK